MPKSPIDSLLQAVEELRPKVRVEHEDLFEDAILRLWKRVCAGAQNPTNCAGLLVKIMHDLRVDRARHEERVGAIEISLPGEQNDAAQAPVVSPLSGAIRSEETELLRIAIGLLEEPTRFVVRARLRGADYRAIAQELMWAVGCRFSETQLRYVWTLGARRVARCLSTTLT